jgi:hypothetical protein
MEFGITWANISKMEHVTFAEKLGYVTSRPITHAN